MYSRKLTGKWNGLFPFTPLQSIWFPVIGTKFSICLGPLLMIFRTLRTKTITFTPLSFCYYNPWVNVRFLFSLFLLFFFFFLFTFLTAFSLNWILLSLLYFNPLPSCLYYHPCVSELGFLPFNPLIGSLPQLALPPLYASDPSLCCATCPPGSQSFRSYLVSFIVT